ncbi:KxYKxGKxW signal protein, partial [human gut metagenome]
SKTQTQQQLKVEVGNDGSATVTFPDGSTATLTGDKTVKEADSKGVQEPGTKTPVQNTSALTQPSLATR